LCGFVSEGDAVIYCHKTAVQTALYYSLCYINWLKISIDNEDVALCEELDLEVAVELL
jgi:hypothetical protein